ncbi:UDP-glucosyltransferase 2-like isoform X1 [Pieris brassicae]|uniref:UDP-glucosyltransferase 2-like isoform X1 n=1 Tax=Pieris brassicae TaxID=7116 RepID=UPI001E660161|nr:UDP-glucosyltransferase 2-like isoform X1 [Pieris brassicae]
MLRACIVICVLILNLHVIQCSKILGYFPTPSISHQVVFRPLMHELAKRGHEVIVVTTDPAFAKGDTPANLTEIDVHDISYKNWEAVLDTHNGKKENIFQQIVNLFERFTSTFDLQLQTPEVKKMLSKEKNNIDLIVVESSVRTTLGLGHLLKAPIIQFSSFGTSPSHFGFFGAPSQPLLYPTPLNVRIYNLTMFEKIFEFLKHLTLDYLQRAMYDSDYAMAKRNFGEDLPPFEELMDKYVQMLFLNEHPIWAHNHPVPSNVIFMGGIHQTEHDALPQDLKTYLDASKHGVIYISFGTNVKPSNLPPEKVELMLKVFSTLPYDILWKWDTELPQKPKNVKTSKWFPQAQLLKHPNIKLFITQGGLQSTDESINAAVPVIGIPMLGDQWYNTERYKQHQIGIQLDIHAMSEEQFSTSVKSVIEDKSYKTNILKLRTLMREFPVKPLDLAVWWTEHILKHGGTHLRSPAFGISHWKYYEVTLVLTVVSVLLLSLFIVVVILRFILRRLLPHLLLPIRIKVKKM